ncbi:MULTISPECIES: outer membrane protein [unclassified Yoonia]|uniref:outer membrane protein n=1 Tax=unclassified Yoonia TaxID=2629118 RepID=UPI002AFEB0B9|nr:MULTISPECIES: outer membrane beta-barrel protein [unclassified Yoonia]
MTVNKILAVAAIALTPAASMAQDWTGAYGGISFGGSDIEATVKPLDDLKLPGDGSSTGLFAGYNYQVGGIVYGAEFDFDATNYNVSDLVLVESTARLKARIGAPVGNGLVYGVAGVVGASTNSVLPDGLGPVSNFAVEDGVGYLIGAGYDMKFGDNLLAGAEVLYHEFDDDALNVEVTTLRLRVGYTF